MWLERMTSETWMDGLSIFGSSFPSLFFFFILHNSKQTLVVRIRQQQKKKRTRRRRKRTRCPFLAGPTNGDLYLAVICHLRRNMPARFTSSWPLLPPLPNPLFLIRHFWRASHKSRRTQSRMWCLDYIFFNVREWQTPSMEYAVIRYLRNEQINLHFTFYSLWDCRFLLFFLCDEGCGGGKGTTDRRTN